MHLYLSIHRQLASLAGLTPKWSCSNKKAMKSQKTLVFALFVLLLFTLVLRFVHLGADPPNSWQTSMGYYSDPGGYAHNSRNKILFEEWQIDKWNMMYTSPIPHFLTYVIFLLFGPGIAQMNAVPALFSCLILLMTYLLLKAFLSRIFALIGVAILGINFIFTVFSQVAVRVMPMLFFVILAIYFLRPSKTNHPKNLFLAGAMCFLAFMAKGTFLLVLPAIILGILAHAAFRQPGKISVPIRNILMFFLGMLAILALWLVFIYLPYRETFEAFGQSNFFWLTHGYKRILEVFWLRPMFYFVDMPILTALSSLALLILAYKAITAAYRISLLSWVCGFWVLSNMVYYAVIYYRAARHYVPLIFPIVILAVSLLHDFWQAKQIAKPERRPLLFFGFTFFWLIFFFSSVIIWFSRPVTPAAWHSNLMLAILLAIAGTLLLYLIFRFWPDTGKFALRTGLKLAVIAFLCMFSLTYNARSTLNWLKSPRYDRKIISQDLGKAFKSMRLAGLVSMVLALENTHAAHAYSTGYQNRGLDFLDKYQITHALLTTHAEEIWNYQRDFPEVMQKAKILARFPLWRTFVVLYDLHPATKSEEMLQEPYEGEAFFGENGLPRYDGEASGKLAFRAEKNPQGALLKLPLQEFPAGEYILNFHIRIEGIPEEDVRIARIDATSENRQKAFVHRDIYCRDITATETYQIFPLRLSLRNSRQLTLRLFSTGKSHLWFDKVIITPEPE